jgi:hypothetical protein
MIYLSVLHIFREHRSFSINSGYWSFSKILGLIAFIVFILLSFNIHRILPIFFISYEQSESYSSWDPWQGNAVIGLIFIILLPVLGLIFIMFPHIFNKPEPFRDKIISDGTISFFGWCMVLFAAFLFIVFK